MHLRRLAALFLLSLPFAVSAYAAHHHVQDAADDNDPAPATLGMVTGPDTGTYIAFGRDIAKIARKDGLLIHIYDSKGSIDNIQRITSKEKVGLAIVQSDVLSFLSRSQNPHSMMVARKLRLVAPLYSEEVHILARNNIDSLADLKGKRVAVGGEGSGSMITAVNIFTTLGITPAKMYEIDPPHGAVAVLSGDADAMVFVGGKPVKMFKNMEELEGIRQGPNAGVLKGVHFLAIDDPRLLKQYRAASLTHDDYSFIEGSSVPTIAVTALLVTYDYTMKNADYYHEQCGNMAKLAKALTAHIDQLKESGHPKWKEVDLTAPVEFWKRDACSAEVFAGAASPASLSPAAGHASPLQNDLLSVVQGSHSPQP